MSPFLASTEHLLSGGIVGGTNEPGHGKWGKEEEEDDGGG